MGNNERKTTQYHSCFMVDVEIDEEKKVAVMVDSTRVRYLFRLDGGAAEAGFRSWLSDVFLAGRAQTLTVFRYHEEGEAPDIDVVIDEFLRPAARMLTEGA